MDVVLVKSAVGNLHRANVAGGQPLRSETDGVVLPGGDERPHFFQACSFSGGGQRIYQPFKWNRIGPSTRTANRRIDQHDFLDLCSSILSRANRDSSTHRMADQQVVG